MYSKGYASLGLTVMTRTVFKASRFAMFSLVNLHLEIDFFSATTLGDISKFVVFLVKAG